MRLCCMLLFVAVMGNAQSVFFEGHVVDSKTGNPIPYANLSFLNSLKGTSSDEDGHFYLEIPERFLDKKVHISSLGYKDTIALGSAVQLGKKVRMIEETYALDEVVVAQSLGDSQVMNPISSYSIKSGFSSAATPWVLALYFPNIGAAKKYLETITVFVRKEAKFKREFSKFRLRIYDVDPKTKKPSRDLVQKSIVLESDINKEFVSIDLAEMGIKIPREGIYIGLEWLFLPSNWYVNAYQHPLTNKPVSEDRFAPTFAAVYQKNQNFRTMVYGLGEWSDFAIKSPGNGESLVPAISIKVSKNK
ncbi:carboxypeptidase-like regulatory domain-containing protein [Maribacter chungangensis]|uniref:Carboxypeptidase-like regulatory domain-containing protein n=1 Tax=Maribacter chungangensis TaxID=1069117 RepID=A0ABW3B3Z4_9FLAO